MTSLADESLKFDVDLGMDVDLDVWLLGLGAWADEG